MKITFGKSHLVLAGVSVALGLGIGLMLGLLLAGNDPSPAFVSEPSNQKGGQVVAQVAEEGAGPSNASDSAGVRLEVEGVERTDELTYSDGEGGSATRPESDVAPDDGDFVLVSTLVENGSKGSIDLSCLNRLATQVVDSEGRKYGPYGDIERIEGNPECNVGLRPGFSDEMTWNYLVPTGAEIVALEYFLTGSWMIGNRIGPTVRIPIEA